MLLDDFFIRALIVGIGIAIIAGPFGCFVVWNWSFGTRVADGTSVPEDAQIPSRSWNSFSM